MKKKRNQCGSGNDIKDIMKIVWIKLSKRMFFWTDNGDWGKIMWPLKVNLCRPVPLNLHLSIYLIIIYQ